MKSNNTWLALLALASLNGCAKVGLSGLTGTSATTSTSSTLPNGTTLTAVSGANVLPLTVDGSLCSSNSYPNKPCVSVTICAPGTTNCQTISDILVDTGSYGLRIFNSVITVPLTTVTTASKTVAECTQFGDGSSDWGPVKIAGVILGGESAVQTPIQVIDSTFSNSSSYCSGADASPSAAGFNGILGVGLFAQDCGANCVSSAGNQLYYACSGSTCSGTALALASQVQNPVSLLPVDKNGVILKLPSIPLGGVTSVNGYLVLGIDTQSNNKSTGVTLYSTDTSAGEFSTSYNGTSYASFIDSGSNSYFFAINSSLPDCGKSNSSYAGWFCPSSTVDFTATNTSHSGKVSGTVAFEIGNFSTLWNSNNSVFMEMGGDGGTANAGGTFDWGLPFYFGRNVYVGIEGQSSNLGAGPYWAY